MEPGAVDRKVMKILVEEFALRSAPVPPCSISSLAVNKQSIDDSSSSSPLIYLGTDSGYVLLYEWKRSPAQSTFSKPRSNPRSSPSTPRRRSVSPSPEESLQLSPAGGSSELEFQNGIEASPERQKSELKLVTHRYLGRGGVESLCMLPKVGQLGVVFDGQFLLLDSSSLGLQGKLPSSRGVSAITRALNYEEKVSFASKTRRNLEEPDHLAVAMKSRVLLLEVHPWQQEKENRASFSSNNISILREIPEVEGALAIAWIKTSVFIGTSREYLLVSLLGGGKPTLLFSFPVDSPCRPMLKSFPNEANVLLVIDIAGIIVNSQGEPVAGTLVFSGIPEALGQSSPYAVVAHKSLVEVFHSKTGCKVQSMAYGGVSTGPCFIAEDDESIVVLAKGDKVSCLVQVTIEDQLKELLKQKEYSEAVKLAKESFSSLSEEDSKTRLAMVYAEAGFLLLNDLRFEEAIDHFLESELVEPVELLLYFPSLSSRWRSSIPRKRYWGLHPPPQPLRAVIENGLFSLQNNLLVSGLKDQASSISNAPSRSVLFNQYLLKSMKHFVRYWETMRLREITGKEAVDTVLLKLCVEIKSSEGLESLVSSNNSCLLEEVEALLKSAGQLRALALLYESKGMLESALEIWHHLSFSKDSSRLDATSEAARLLESSSDKNIILQHIIWVINLDDEIALRILTSTKREISLPADDVLQVLRPDSRVRQRYLQWLIESQGVEDSYIHTELALSLAGSALKTAKEQSRLTLQQFLESSNRYDVTGVLKLIEGTFLWKEQATLHMKLGNEVLALEILALKLNDQDAAEKYCAELGRPDAFLQLLYIYLANKGSRSHAIRLLHRQGSQLDPMEVLEALPSDMPLHEVSQAIVRMLRARVHSYRHGQIAKNLTKGVNFQTHIARLHERSREVQITSETVCSSCNARIGTKLFAAYPDNSIVCYKCLRLRGEN